MFRARHGLAVWLCVGCLLQAGEQLTFRALGPREGLPAASVHAVVQDLRGFLWFGTYDGLVRYDGVECRVFRHDPQEPRSLPGNRVRDLEVDAGGDLWIAVEGGGVAVWRPKAEHFETFRAAGGGAADDVRCLLRDRGGRIWAGTFGVGVMRLDAGTGRFEPAAADPAMTARVLDLLEDGEGRIWVGTDGGGLQELDPRSGRVEELQVPAGGVGMPRNVRVLAEDAGKNLWIGTDRGLFRLDPARRVVEGVDLGLEEPSSGLGLIVDALLIDRQGRLWVGTDGAGLARLDSVGAPVVRFRYEEGVTGALSSDVVRRVYEDRAGDVWVGTYPNSVNQGNALSGGFRTYRSSPGATQGLAGRSVTALMEDPSGDLWFGTTPGGLNRLEAATGRWSVYRHDDRDPGSLSGKAVTTLIRDRAGRLWAGTWNGGLNRLDPGAAVIRRYLPEESNTNSLSNPHVWDIAEDLQQRLWVATLGGLNRFDADRDGFVRYLWDRDNPRTLNHNAIWALLVARDGGIWAGTQSGVARWDAVADAWDRVAGLDGLYVVDMAQDRAGGIWVATQDQGLRHFDPGSGQVETFRVAEGLPSDSLCGVVEDDAGFLWVTTNNGLVRFDLRTRKFDWFDETHGIAGMQFNKRARLRLESGQLLFGGTQGATQVDPSRVERNEVPPVVVFTALELQGRVMLPGGAGSPLAASITETRQVDISSRQSVIGVQFAALSYRSPARSRYLYKLEGFDTEWRSAGPERRALYTNLDPGRYRLRVRAANNDGVWSREDAELELVVVPEWWQRVWVRWGAGLGLASMLWGLGWALAGWRTRSRLREVEAERRHAKERQRVIAALNESRTILAQVLNAVPLAIFWKDQDSRYQGCNSVFARTVGLGSPEAIVGKTDYDLPWPQAEAEAYVRDDREVMEVQRAKRHIIEPLQQADGSRLWIDTTKVPLVGAGGRAQGVLGIFEDITERRQAQEALEQSEERYRTLFSSMQEGFSLHEVICDAAGKPCDYRYLDVNPTFERMTGIPRAQWVGRTVREVLPQIEDSWIERFGRVALGGGPIEYEDFVKSLGRHYRVTAYSPQPGRFAVISYDITERKRAEAALRESEERFRTLVESQGEGVGVVDENERFVFVNPAAEEIFGVTRGSLAGRTLLEFLNEADRRLVEVQSSQRRAGEKSVYELAFRRPDGAERVLMVTATPRFQADGAYAGTLGVFRDVTELKRAEAERLGLERQMQQTQKLESLGVLAGGVAHDFNNLLTSILGNASLAQAELTADGSGQHLREIEEAARRAADLCRQMLAYAGKGRFMIEQLDLNQLIEKMLQLLKTSTSKKAVLKLDLGRDLPAVRGDATQIRQILMNLITNASEALGDGEGVIAVSTTARHCTSAELREGLLRQELPAGKYVCVQVTDTGCGMDPETQRRIFEPFFTTKFTGRGLGLSAVLGIVRGHQGTLQLDSRPGEGTTFRVWFPAAPDAEVAGVAPAVPVGQASWKGSGVVLLVDDEEGVRKVGQRMLERLGFEVVTAADGDEALERYRERKKPFALVLLDLTMPRRDGAETLVELRRLDPAVRVMIASGYTEVDVAGRFAGQELAGFVQKPFDLVELQSRLRAALEGR